jgi:hypothetical protein
MRAEEEAEMPWRACREGAEIPSRFHEPQEIPVFPHETKNKIPVFPDETGNHSNISRWNWNKIPEASDETEKKIPVFPDETGTRFQYFQMKLEQDSRESLR